MRSGGAKSMFMPKSNGKSRKGVPTVVRCRGCNTDLVKGSPQCVRVQIGTISGIEHGIEDFDESHQPWGYMHIRCFLLGIGDPRALDVMTAEARTKPAVPTAA